MPRKTREKNCIQCGSAFMTPGRDVRFCSQKCWGRFSFWSHVVKTDTCWTWTGCLDDDGYGGTTTRDNGVRITTLQRAHRVAYTELIGEIPDGLELDHTCRNRACVNPAHLEPVTTIVNLLRSTVPWIAWKAATHCVKGHEYTPANTTHRTGKNAVKSRQCRACIKAWKDAAPKVPPKQKPIITHCPKGHEYTESNTGFQKKGGGLKYRYCRTCARTASLQYYYDKKLVNLPMPHAGVAREN